MSEHSSRPDIAVDPGQDQEVREPPMFKVLLYNDDYTTMEFVVAVLMGIFDKSETEAMHIMLSVHKKGVGVCGVYTSEVAETKVAKVHDLARENGYPLRSGMEEV